MNRIPKSLLGGLLSLFCTLHGTSRGQSLGEVLNATNLLWLSSGEWSVQTNETQDGVAAIRLGAGINTPTEGWVQTILTGPTGVTFWWKASCYEGCSYLEFLINGVIQGRVTGEVDWQERSFWIPEGTQTLRWRYTGSCSSSTYTNAGWLDEVRLSEPVPPTILQDPTNQTVAAAETVVLRAEVAGTEPWRLRWRLNGTDVPGATNLWLSITNVQATQAGDYTLVLTTPIGSVTSQVATLTVLPMVPFWSRQPLAQAAPDGATVTFTTTAQGSEPLNYQWYFANQALAGATTSALRITNVGPAKYGDYWAVVTNAYGSATSAVATLSYSPVVAWGYGESLTNVPPGATNVIALTGGDSHSLALRADGTVVAWGGGSSGQNVVPPEATNLVSITAGSWHSLGLRQDGTVVLWGHILGSYNNSTVPAEVTNVTALALGPGAQHALALKADGTVVDWGLKAYGLTNEPPEATNVVAVAAGAHHSVVLRGDGRVVVWGDNSYGETNVPPSATNVVAIAAGWHHTLALRADGSIVAWGATGMHNYGQTRVPAEAVNVVAIACGGEHSLALRADGKVLAWGDSSDGQTKVPAWVTNVAAIAGTSYDSLALLGDGPPRISAQPMSRVAIPGETVRLVASAVGALPLSYQWLKEGVPVPGAAAAWLFLTNYQAEAAAGYALVASNALGMVTSRVATVTVKPSAPRLVGMPATVVAPSNSVAWIAVDAIGSPPLSYQWYFGGTNLLLNSDRISGADAATLVISQVRTADVGGYSVVVTNGYGAVTSSVAMLRFATAPESVAQAVDALDRTWMLPSPTNWFWQADTAHDGQDAAQSPALADNRVAEFTTTNYGPAAVSFWWKVSSQTNGDYLKFVVDGTEQARLSGEVDWQWRSFLIPMGMHTLRWQYIKNASLAGGRDCGWVDQVRFGPVLPPTLTRSPLGGTGIAGSNFTFSVAATGTEPLVYHWRRNGLTWISTTDPALTLANLQLTQGGNYSVVVSNLAGVVTSAEAVLQVIPGRMRIVPNSMVWADGQMRFTADGPAGLKWLLQSSTNLLDWEEALTLTNTTGSLEFTDPAASSAQRFYRLRFVP